MMWPRWVLRLKEGLLPARRIAVVEADTPPANLPLRNLVLAKEDNEDWAVAFRCPCGCGKRLELLLIKEVTPHWTISVSDEGKPTLYPSIWLKAGCKSHFWLRNGKVIWV